MALTEAARSSLGDPMRIVSATYGPGLRRAIVTSVLLGAGLSTPCLAQRVPTTPTFDTWSSLEVGQPARHSVLSILPKPRTYKSLGLWVGFGLGVVAVPFVWSTCERGRGSCHANEKILIAGALPLSGAVLGSLVGRQFKKRDEPVKTNAAADSAGRVSTDSLLRSH